MIDPSYWSMPKAAAVFLGEPLVLAVLLALVVGYPWWRGVLAWAAGTLGGMIPILLRRRAR